MTRASRAAHQRFQVNVPLGAEHWHIALLQLAIRENKTVPELLRPVIIRYLKRQLSIDPQLAAAVRSLEESKATANEKDRRRRRLAQVMEIPDSSRPPKQKKPGREEQPKPTGK